MNSKALVAEFVGTFALIFIGVGAIASNAIAGAGFLGVALAHGLTIAAMVSATAAISGGHLNPAVTIGLLLARKIDGPNALGYIIAQCLGGVAAAGALAVIIPQRVRAVGFGTPNLADGLAAVNEVTNIQAINPLQGIMIEAILTFFLVFVIYGTAVDRRAPKVGGLFIGLTVTLDILMGGPLTGAAMNPARHLGPALFAGGENITNIWIYWVGPVLGGVLAALLYRHVLEEEVDPDRTQLNPQG